MLRNKFLVVFLWLNGRAVLKLRLWDLVKER